MRQSLRRVTWAEHPDEQLLPTRPNSPHTVKTLPTSPIYTPPSSLPLRTAHTQRAHIISHFPADFAKTAIPPPRRLACCPLACPAPASRRPYMPCWAQKAVCVCAAGLPTCSYGLLSVSAALQPSPRPGRGLPSRVWRVRVQRSARSWRGSLTWSSDLPGAVLLCPRRGRGDVKLVLLSERTLPHFRVCIHLAEGHICYALLLR